MKPFLRCACLSAALAASACQPAAPAAGDDGMRAEAAKGQVAEPDPIPGTVEDLRQRAARAMGERRVYAPAGDNAVEYFLAARERRQDDADVRGALVELQPYLLIAAEQALERGSLAESERLLALIARVDSRAPALPRLQLALREAQERAAQPSLPQTEAETPATQTAAAPVLPLPSSAPAAVPAPSSPVASAETVPAPGMPPAAAAAPPSVESTAAAPSASAAAPPRTPPARTPRLLQDAAPRYPLPALRRKVEGQAEVAFTIQPDGSVRDVRLLSSTPAGMFDDSAVAVASRWRFEATGQAHASRRTVLFRLPQ